MPKYDAEITKLFNEGLGARIIAKQLGIKHHATVGKRLIKLKLKRPVGSNQAKICSEKLDINLDSSKCKLDHMAHYVFDIMCLKYGFVCLKPLVDVGCDRVADFGKGPQKIQIKSSSCKLKSGNCTFKLTRTRNNATSSRRRYYDASEVDYFFLVDTNMNCWLIPFRLLQNRGNVIPMVSFPGFKLP